jgi:hypothetical protein
VTGRTPRSVRGRVAAYVGAVAVLAAMLGPPLRSPPRDSYPLSTYPMFSSDRGRISSVATVVALDRGGAVHRLDPHLVSGADEVMLAVQTAANAVRRGPEASLALCQDVADRVSGAGGGLGDVTEVVVRVERHDAVAHFTSDPTPLSVVDHADCPVPR